eukprot:2566937-Karenia_brevis.AAC.1
MDACQQVNRLIVWLTSFRKVRVGQAANRGPHKDNPGIFKVLTSLKIAVLVTWAVGYVGVRVGEASKPGPGSQIYNGLQLASVNVTSLSSQFEEVASLSCQAVALQETRLNEWGQKEMAREMKKHGWQLLCGHPQPQQKRKRGTCSEWNAKHGGVGMLIKEGMDAIVAPVTSATRKKLWRSGRWMHVVIGIDGGRQALHIMSVWGYAGAGQKADKMEANEELLEAILAEAAELGPVPVIICGDFNIDPAKSRCLTHAVATGVWHDLAVAAAFASGSSPQATCFPRPTSAGTRIDAMICNSLVLPAVRDFKLLDEINVPTHRALHASIDVQVYGKKVSRICLPRAFPVGEWPEWEESQEEKAALESLLSCEGSWQSALAARNVEALWEAWCCAAEDYLLKR